MNAFNVLRQVAIGVAAVPLVASCSMFKDSDAGKTEPITPSTGGSGGSAAADGSGASAAGGAGQDAASGGSSATTCDQLPGAAMVEITVTAGVKFCIDRTEVTQAQYAAFLKAPGKPGSEHADCGINTTYAPQLKPGGGPRWEPGGGGCVEGVAWTPDQTPERPVGCVDWCDAYAFCAWAGKRLCGKVGGGPGTASTTALDPNDSALSATQSQWYATCSQGGKTLYPYGDSYGKEMCEGLDAANEGGGKQDVGSHPECHGTSAPYASVVDLSGSVMELTDECTLDTTSPTPVAVCAARGGGYSSQGTGLDCKHYAGLARDAFAEYVGFRCCKDLP